MFRRVWLGGAVLALLLAACSPRVEPTSAPEPEEPMADESMDDEMMEEEPMDEEMSDEEAMDEEMSGEEPMDEEMSEEEAMDEEMMDDEMHEVAFTVRIENLSVILAPGVWAVHTEDDPLFTTGEPDRGAGLEALAEDGDPAGLDEALEGYMGVLAHGVFNTPMGADEPGPLEAGAAYEFTFKAAPGSKLSFATMFVQSNDLFYAPDAAGIDLFDEDGEPLNGNLTDQVFLWDAGTEVNQEPGVGPDQAPRQAGPNTGADENGVVQIVSDMYTYPDTADAIQITITPEP